ncbi:DUF1045 domain-containing protein [Rhodobacteraceae bacterium 2CG4]|uniref:DUF1045 domain-containing protein n=1 Tax=Halovulum marinum TaxID=2662447 RepID=A0A6L5YW47_9RHOB|nr:DUF1045 domain-containing protein [Halovulum marinum]MSU88573.1 DUF1045 domain-containing protein [Halovulum marinum]
MTGDCRRYAIYAAPEPDTALARFGAAWLGWDAERGTAVPALQAPGLPRPLAEITRQPRRYGFHGTLKAPFRPVAGPRRAELEAALDRLAAAHAPVRLGRGLRLARLARFLALVPVEESRPLATLAEEAVAAFEPFRAALTEDELARRRAAGLNARQDALLQRWGYPYVMEEFRFHMTLTGPLQRHELDPVAEALRRRLPPLAGRPWTLASLCLFGEGDDGRFRILRRAALRGGGVPAR